MARLGIRDENYLNNFNKTHWEHTGILKKSFLWSVPQIIGWDDTGPFPLFHTPWLVSGRNGPAENHSERE